MNKRIEELAIQTNLAEAADVRGGYVFPRGADDFAKAIVYDFLSELTNDDALGDARIDTIQRLAEKWGVARGTN